MPVYSPVKTNEDQVVIDNDSETSRLEAKKSDDVSTTESQLEKLPYPKHVMFIVVNEFCERFCYYGMRTILSLYLVNELLYSENEAKIIYHTWTMLCYFFPLLGAIISDSWWGKFRTIFYISMIYALGNTVLAIASIKTIDIPHKELSILGLVLISIGTGGIKPCVSAFGGDQFILPQQEFQIAVYFSMFYFSINAGSLISTLLTPIIREDVHCFDSETCYPVAFAVPGVLMIVSIIIFGLGKPLYKIVQPQGNVMVKVVKCMCHALSQKFKSKQPQEHWLDHAKDKYDEKQIQDIKITLKVLVLYIPLPIFWALYDQQGTGWTFQAVRMKGDIGGWFTILPDQMQVVNPLLILAFIPFFTYVVYPLFDKCHILRTPLQRMVCGGFLAAAAFAVTACLAIVLENTYPVLPTEGNGQLRIFNPMNCQATLTSDLFKQPITLSPMDYKYWEFDVDKQSKHTYTLTCDKLSYTGSITIIEEKQVDYYLNDKGFKQFFDDISKNSEGHPKIRILAADGTDSNFVELINSDGGVEEKIASTNITQFTIAQGDYTIKGFTDESIHLGLGGVYTLLLNLGDKSLKLHTLTDENSVHMLWLLPQYIILTAAEIMFSITGLEFAYSQAPVSMKSLLQACWLLTTAVGNLIIVIIESIEVFEKQSQNYFLYTGLMIVDLVLFTYLAYRYEYVEIIDSEPGTELEDGTDNPAFKRVDDS